MILEETFNSLLQATIRKINSNINCKKTRSIFAVRFNYAHEAALIS